MIRVLVVDDSASTRLAWQRILCADPELAVVGGAPDPFAAREMVVALKPDVVTLDLEMPRMDGLSFLRRLMHYYPLPVVIVSSHTARFGERALEALRAGAVGVLCKPANPAELEPFAAELVVTVKAAARAHLLRRPRAPAGPPRPPRAVEQLRRATNAVVALGASTGGTVAIESILEALPPHFPGTVIVQHMPAAFTRAFAERLNRLAGVEVREAADGDAVLRGLALVAPGDKHMVVRRSGLGFSVQLKNGPPVNGHRPSVDVLFQSVALAAGPSAVGALLTGMGADGARGLLHLRQAGAATLAQDEASSVVFGMPKAAIDLQAAGRVVGLEQMPAALSVALGQKL